MLLLHKFLKKRVNLPIKKYIYLRVEDADINDNLHVIRFNKKHYKIYIDYIIRPDIKKCENIQQILTFNNGTKIRFFQDDGTSLSVYNSHINVGMTYYDYDRKGALKLFLKFYKNIFRLANLSREIISAIKFVMKHDDESIDASHETVQRWWRPCLV